MSFPIGPAYQVIIHFVTHGARPAGGEAISHKCSLYQVCDYGVIAQGRFGMVFYPWHRIKRIEWAADATAHRPFPIRRADHVT
jgi:hypothetical protein